MKTVKYSSVLIPLLVLSFISGCDKASKSSDVQTIDLANSISSFALIPLSSIALKIEYIPLLTEENCLFGPIREIVVSDDTIIVQGYDYCKTFDKNGKFLFNIGSIGKGPAEYQYVNSFSVNPAKHLIYITCNGEIKVFTYKGLHVQKINIPFETWSRSKFINDSTFCHQVNIFNGSESNKLYFFNPEGEIKDSFINRKPYERRHSLIVSEQPQIYPGYSYTIYKDGLNDTLYKISSDLQTSPLYKIDFGKNKISLDLIKESNEIPFQDYIFLNEIDDSKYYTFMDFKFGNHYPFKYRKEGTLSGFGQNVTYSHTEVAGIYNKIESTFTFLDGENGMGFINDIDGGLSFWPTYIDHGTDAMYAWVNAYEFVNMFAGNQDRKYSYSDSLAHIKLKQQIKSLNPMGNPVIIKVTSKLE